MSATFDAHFKVGNVTIIRFPLRRMLNAAAIDTRLREITASPPMDTPDTILDFSQVEFISSAVLNKLIVLDRAIRSLGGQLVLCELSPRLRDLLSVTRLDHMLQIVDDQRAALHEFGLTA